MPLRERATDDRGHAQKRRGLVPGTWPMVAIVVVKVNYWLGAHFTCVSPVRLWICEAPADAAAEPHSACHPAGGNLWQRLPTLSGDYCKTWL